MLGFDPLASRPLADISGTLPAGLYAAVGTYTYTGNAVALRKDYTLAIAVGAFTLSGKDVDFFVSISQEAIFRVLLVGSSAHTKYGFKMITNFQMVAGDDKTLVVSIKDAEGNAVNITGATFKWQCARSYGKASAISKTSSSGIAITDGANGTLTVTLSGSDTESLSGTYVHELQMTLNSIVSTPIVGTMKVNKALIEAT